MIKTNISSFLRKLIMFLIVPVLILSVSKSSAYSSDFEQTKNYEPRIEGYSDWYTVVLSDPCPYKSGPFPVYVLDISGNSYRYEINMAYNLLPESEDKLKDTIQNLDTVFKNIFEQYSYEDFMNNAAIIDVYEDFRYYLDTNGYEGDGDHRAAFQLEALGVYEENARAVFEAIMGSGLGSGAEVINGVAVKYGVADADSLLLRLMRIGRPSLIEGSVTKIKNRF